jgi:hypothetical protein
MLYLCEDVGVASCSLHILCSYNLTLGAISSVYPDSVNGQDLLLIVSSSSFRPIPSSFVTSLHFGMILDNKVPTPTQSTTVKDGLICILGTAVTDGSGTQNILYGNYMHQRGMPCEVQR